MLTLEALSAKKGDCLILHFESDGEAGIVLIDGGPATVYEDVLKPRLQALRAEHNRRTGDDGPLPIDLLVISHVDDDHIHGILDMTKDLRRAGSDMQGRIAIDRVWHNTFDDIFGAEPEAGDTVLSSITPEIIDDDPDEPDDVLATHIRHHAFRVLASLGQGEALRNDARALDWSLNAPFEPFVRAVPGADSDDELTDDLVFHVIGPLKPELDDLQEKYRKYLEKKARDEATAEDALAAYADKSVPNLSSIVILAQEGDRKILLTGDARGDRVLAGLEEMGHMPPGGTLEVDVLKLMHHGSNRNVEPDFFRRVPARHYVFCGDGEHGNPERGTLEMLFDVRPGGGFVLHFTHEIDEIDAEREKDHVKLIRRIERLNERRRAAGKPRKPVPAAWDAGVHSIAALLAGKRADGVDFETNTPGDCDRVEIRLR